MITKEQVEELLTYNPETGEFHWKVDRRGGRNAGFLCARAGDRAGWADERGYLRVRINGRSHRLHRLAWLVVYGVNPEGHIDHEDGDTANNRIRNLRDATRAQNMHNQGVRKGNTSGFKGVFWDKQNKTWTAQIRTGGKRLRLGAHKTPEAAHAAYVAAAQEYHGEFARTV